MGFKSTLERHGKICLRTSEELPSPPLLAFLPAKMKQERTKLDTFMVFFLI
jgi:hypothetical protein